ncbi:hypothetical protein M758_8G065900 [Ceratodon purpureus]|uniref:Secreted protein n=1 Tax=Ceratodon purpureus TaxID=3225 RepID=A0A8T0GYG5_CERPU|nr:hypothetical protein KC19_8G069900 [Ceratodon purpureus]KAG0607941.1 hypothetical protein M758_8G065900 [Ceratodon purpureus]
MMLLLRKFMSLACLVMNSSRYPCRLVILFAQPRRGHDLDRLYTFYMHWQRAQGPFCINEND